MPVHLSFSGSENQTSSDGALLMWKYRNQLPLRPLPIAIFQRHHQFNKSPSASKIFMVHHGTWLWRMVHDQWSVDQRYLFTIFLKNTCLLWDGNCFGRLATVNSRRLIWLANTLSQLPLWEPSAGFHCFLAGKLKTSRRRGSMTACDMWDCEGWIFICSLLAILSLSCRLPKKMMVNECVTPPGARALNIEQVSFAQLLHGPRLFIRVMLPWYWKTEIGDRSNCQTVKQWLRPSDTQTAKERQTDKLSQTEGLIIYMTGYKQNMKITIP